jgi:phytoene synthase
MTERLRESALAVAAASVARGHLPGTALAERELTMAGISDPSLRRAYLVCRELNAVHGKTFFLSTLLLPPQKRPYVHALYGFARYADEIVDDMTFVLSLPERRQRLASLGQVIHSPGSAPAGDEQATAVSAALQDTMARWSMPAELFDAFLLSMQMDLTVSEYATWDDLQTYIYGSAAVIGLQMLPILEPLRPAAADYAQELGVAFQLANFIRDVGEDLRRGRIYLPMESLELFGLTRRDLEAGVVDGRVRRLLAFEIARCRELFRSAASGVRLLHPTSRPCIETALTLYGGILDEVEARDYQVLDHRVTVGAGRRLSVALPALIRARRARHQPELPERWLPLDAPDLPLHPDPAGAVPTTPTSTTSG